MQLAAWNSHASEYQLFALSGEAKSKAHSNYKEIVDSLKPGDRVKFSDGSVVELAEYLGRGNTSLVFGIKGDSTSVIRIPRISDMFKTLMIPRAAITTYANANLPLVKLGADVPKVKGGLDLEFLIVERMPIVIRPGQDFTLNQFLQNQAQTAGSSRAEAEDALLDFVRKTAGIASIGDIHSDQFVYSRSQKRWILLDWSGPIHSAFDINALNEVVLSEKTHQLSVMRRAMLGSIADRSSPDFKELAKKIQKTVKRERFRIIDEDPMRARQMAGVSKNEWPRVVGKRNGLGLLIEGLCTKQFEWLALSVKAQN